MSRITGLYSVTSVTADVERAFHFYVGSLGLKAYGRVGRLDEQGMLHFCCSGSARSVISLIIDANAERGVSGSRQVSNIGLSIPLGSYEYWLARLLQHGVSVQGNAWCFGERYLCFTDPDGLALSLIEGGISNDGLEGRLLDGHFAVGEIRSIELSLVKIEQAAGFLTRVLGFSQGEQDGAMLRFKLRYGVDPITVDLLRDPKPRAGRSGPGTVHHVSWRVADVTALVGIQRRMATAGYPADPTPSSRDASFMAPGGVRFALTTDELGV
jgi:glyoxalase family protein